MARKVKIKKGSVRRSALRKADTVTCNDTLSNYASEITVPYGGAQPRPKCEPPTAEEKGAAINAAKNRFKADAEAYCNTGTCPDSPSRKCVSKVTITSVTDEGIVETTEGEMKRCGIKFKIVGNIECSCTPKAA